MKWKSIRLLPYYKYCQSTARSVYVITVLFINILLYNNNNNLF